MLEFPARHSVLFITRFTQSWKSREAVLIFFSGTLAVIFVTLFIVFLFLILLAVKSKFYDMLELYILAEVLILTLLFPSAFVAMFAPRVLARVASSLVEQYNFAFLLFAPLSENDIPKSPMLEFFSGSPQIFAKVNTSFEERIWWLSSRKKPELLLEGIAEVLGKRNNANPQAIDDPDLPVSLLGGIIIRQWYLYATQIAAWISCCAPTCVFLFVVPLIIIPVGVAKVIQTVHTLAYAAAYYRILAERWPWE